VIDEMGIIEEYHLELLNELNSYKKHKKWIESIDFHHDEVYIRFTKEVPRELISTFAKLASMCADESSVERNGKLRLWWD